MVEMKNKVKLTLTFDVKDKYVSEINRGLNALNEKYIHSVDKLTELVRSIGSSSNITVVNIQHNLSDFVLAVGFELHGCVHRLVCKLDDVIGDIDDKVERIEQLYLYLHQHADSAEMCRDKSITKNRITYFKLYNNDHEEVDVWGKLNTGTKNRILEFMGVEENVDNNTK